MTAPTHFRIEAEGWWVLTRTLLGFVSVIMAEFALEISRLDLWAGLILVVCVWFDTLTGWYFRRRGPKSPSTSALEIYADVVCFVAAPIQFALALLVSLWPLALMPVFLLAAVYRLARFQVQGLVGKGYVGLPVTYNGYLFPLAGLAIHFASNWADAILAVLLVATSALMVSSRFIVPEF